MEMQTTDRPVVYRIGKFDLILPHDHKLPEYQREHRLYDRFPQFLASHVEDGAIIDIGANVGDTAAAFATAADNPIICIEPESTFFVYLTKNAEMINRTRDQVRCYPFAIGPKGTRGKIDSSSSTGTFIMDSEGAYETVPLDVLVAKLGPDTGQICLIKSDTDGLDGFIIDSGRMTIRQYEPLLFFECDFKSDEQFAAMLGAFDFLEESGYDSLSVFDNYGNLIAVDTDFRHAGQILTYCKSQADKTASLEFCYIDILASTKLRRGSHVSAIQEYQESIYCISRPDSPAKSS